MLILGLIAALVVILYKRATEIVVVKPLSGVKSASSNDLPDFAAIMGAVQQAAAQPKGKSERGRSAIRALVSNNQFYEAIKLYQRVYGVDQETAKKAVDEMMLQ